MLGACQLAIKVGHQLAAGRGDRDRRLGDALLDGTQPGRIAAAGTQQVRTLARRALEGGDARGVGGVDRQHQAVEKASPARGALGEQPVHGRGEPEQAQMLPQRILVAQRLTVGQGAAAQGVAVVAGLDLARAEMPVDIGAQTKCAAVAAVDLGELGAPQAAARAQERDRLQQVGLAGSIVAMQHDRPGARVQRDMGVVAEVAQLQPSNCLGPAGHTIGARLRGQGLRVHTRMGMST